MNLKLRTWKWSDVTGMKDLKLKRTGVMLVFFLLFTCIPCMASAQSAASLRLVSKESGSSVTVTAAVDSGSDISAVQFVMTYDSSVLKLEKADLQGAYQSMMIAMNTNDPGVIRLAAASASAVKGDKNIFKAVFTVQKNDNTVCRLSDVVLGFENGEQQYPADAGFDISLSGTSSGSGSGSGSSSGSSTGSGSSSSGSSGSNANTDSDGAGSGAAVQPFNDIKGSWAEKYIISAYDAKLMQGYGDKVFGPDRQITRAQMAVVLWNSEGQQKPSKVSAFTDLKADWYKDAVSWAAEKGYVKGVGHNKFNPDGTLTREQLAQILMNKSGQKSGMETIFTSIYDSQYKDSGSISSWAKPALYWSLYNGVLCGDDSVEIKDTLSAKQPASRAQIAVMLVKYQEKFAVMNK